MYQRADLSYPSLIGHNFGFRPLGYHFIDKRQQQCFIIQKRDELKRGATTGSTPKCGSNGGNL